MSPEQKQYERAFEVIEAYGADAAKWPQDERSSIERCVAQSAELQAHLQTHAALDESLNNLVARPSLNPEIIAQQIAAHPQRISIAQRLQLQLERLTESMMVAFWKPVFAASFVFLVGVGAGTVALEPVEDWSQAEHISFALIGEE
ncbi:MAG: hypothetical protein DWQ28_12140 [Proteobacteria bacterium]|nr:MAG: hypothetical protein DWQ28_12140 [Pseudomonadota bacterium]